MSAALPSPPASGHPATRRLALSVAGMVLTRWMSVSVDRNLRDIAGSFSVTYRDAGREAQSFNPNLDVPPFFAIVKAGMDCTVSLDGTMVLSGFVDEVEVDWEGSQLTCTITGRDATGDLVDCAAAPNGPVEYRNVTTLQIAQAICKPFGISVTQDVPSANVFPVFGFDPDETALSVIEKAARQDALLVTSNGVGGLILTQGGSSRAPASLTRPGNIAGGGGKVSWAQRFSDYYVKGQTNRSVIRKAQAPAMTHATDPRTAPAAAPVAAATVTEAAVSLMTGRSVDPQITRYRPNVRMVKTQAGAATVQQQSDWALRVAKGMGSTLNYKVLDWRANPAGPGGALWLPNQLVNVNDAFVDLNQDMLISGVSYRYDGTGEFTMLELAGPTAFDRIDEPASDPRYIVARKPTSFGPTRQG